MSENPPISRRDLFVHTATITGGTIALGAVVAACGGDSGSSTTTQATSAFVMSTEITVVKRFPDGALVPGLVRLPVSLADQNSILSSDDLPMTLTGKLINIENGDLVQDGLSAQKHAGNAPSPYWPFIATIPKPGLYKIVVDGAHPDGAGMQISAADEVPVPVPGDLLPSVVTPTVENPLDVDPLCTLTPKMCPLHEVSLDVALKTGKPVAYIIGTPAHCTTGTCAPALNYLLDIAKEFKDKAVFIHAEVYADKAATVVTNAVSEFSMMFEPALFVTDKNGVLVERLDSTFDDVEIKAALKKAGVS